MTKRKVFGAAFVALLAALGFTQAMLDRQALSQGDTVQAPVFEVDPLWPKPLPNHWLLGWKCFESIHRLDAARRDRGRSRQTHQTMASASEFFTNQSLAAHWRHGARASVGTNTRNGG